MAFTSEGKVRAVIRHFNVGGFNSLDPEIRRRVVYGLVRRRPPAERVYVNDLMPHIHADNKYCAKEEHTKYTSRF